MRLFIVLGFLALSACSGMVEPLGNDRGSAGEAGAAGESAVDCNVPFEQLPDACQKVGRREPGTVVATGH